MQIAPLFYWENILPNNKKHNEYIGWVPTISGRLFFENWNCSKLLKKPFYKSYSIRQVGSDQVRRVILSTTVDWKDLKFWGDGVFNVILRCSGGIADDKIRGTIYIYPQSFISKDKKENLVDINTLISNISKADKRKNDIQTSFEELSEKLESVEENEFYVVNFTVNRRGFALVSYNIKKSYKGKEVNPQTPKVICRQAFYFIKYSLHQHQHHHSQDDSLTEIHPNSDSAGMEMIEDLKRGLVSMKRDFHALGHYCLFDAGGIVAYTKSLAESCFKEGKIKKEEYLREVSYLSNISDSLNKIAENEERIVNRKASMSDSFRSVIGVFLAIVAPLTILYKEEIRAGFSKQENTYFTFEYIISFLSTIYSNGILYISIWLVPFIIFTVIIKVIKHLGGKSVRETLMQKVESILKKPTITHYISFFSSILITLLIIIYILQALKS